MARFTVSYPNLICIFIGCWFILSQHCNAFPSSSLSLYSRDTASLDARYSDVLKALNLNQQWSQQIYKRERIKNKNAVFSRNTYVADLKSEIDRIQGLSGLNQDSLLIRLYADAIRFNNGDTITLKPSTTLYLYCRDLDTNGGGGAKTLSIKYAEMATVVFVTNSIPGNIKVNFQNSSGGKQQSVTATVPSGKYGLMMSVEGDNAVQTAGLKQPNHELAQYDYITDLTSTHSNFVEDDFVRLLRFQLMVADSMQKKDRSLAIGIMQYTKATTSTSGPAASLYLQSSATLTQLQLTSTGRIFVSKRGITSAQTDMAARLQAASDLDAKFYQFLQMETSADNWQKQASVMLDQAKYSQEQFADLSTQAQQVMDQAETALITAQNNMADLQLNLPRVWNKFQMGIEDLKFKTTLRILVSVAEAVVAIGIGAATAQPEAIAAVPEEVGAMAKEISTIAKIIKSLKDIADKLGGITKISNQLKSLVTSVQKALAKGVTNSDIPNQITIPDLQNAKDPVEAVAELDSFQNQAEIAYGDLAGKKIDGKDEYFQALYELADSGKQVVNAQLAYMQAAQAYSRTLTQQYYSNKYLASVTQYVSNLKDPVIYDVVLRAVFDRVADNRMMLADLLDNYIGTYVFYSLNTNPPQYLQVPYMSETSVYSDAYAKLQSLSNSAVEQFTPQNTLFTLSSSDAANSLMFFGWNSALANGGDGLKFTISATHSAFNGYSRVRIIRVRPSIVGVSSGTISADVTLPQYFDDKLLHSATTVSFVMARASKLNFKKDYSGGGKIITDGQYSTKDLLNPTPFGNWTIQMDASSDILKTAKGLSLEIQCEVTR